LFVDSKKFKSLALITIRIFFSLKALIIARLWTTMRSIKRNMLTLNLRAIPNLNEAKYSI